MVNIKASLVHTVQHWQAMSIVPGRTPPSFIALG